MRKICVIITLVKREKEVRIMDVNNLSLKQYKGLNPRETDAFGYESKVTFNPIDYYKLFFNQEVKRNGLKVDEEYYVRGFGNIESKVFVAYYKSYKSEKIYVAYKSQDHLENLRTIGRLIQEEY
jgi:hypothetical protein